jgi:dUTP pyrophosphatase
MNIVSIVLNKLFNKLFSVDVKIKVLPHARTLPIPRYMSDGAAGFDLYAAIEDRITIPPFETRLIPTGIMVELPRGYELQIRPRSGLALNYKVTVLNSPGTIDWDYRGEIKVILINLSNSPFTIQRGDRIAQAILSRVYRANLIVSNELNETVRGDKGFGSTGI